MQLHYMLYYRKPKACAAGLLRAALVYSVEALKDALLLILWDAYAVVLDRENCLATELVYRHIYGAALIVVADSILAEILNELREKLPVASYHTVSAVKIECYFSLLGIHLQIFHAVLDQTVQIKLFKALLRLAGIKLRELYDIID